MHEKMSMSIYVHSYMKLHQRCKVGFCQLRTGFQTVTQASNCLFRKSCHLLFWLSEALGHLWRWGWLYYRRTSTSESHIWEISTPADFVSPFYCCGSVDISLKMPETLLEPKNPRKVEKGDLLCYDLSVSEFGSESLGLGTNCVGAKSLAAFQSST